MIQLNQTLVNVTMFPDKTSQVFLNGKFTKYYTFDEVKENANRSLKVR